MFTINSKLSELRKRKQQIQDENKGLIDKINEVTRLSEEYDMMDTNHCLRNRGGYTKRLTNLVEFNDKWRNTVFWTHRKEMILNNTLISDLPSKKELWDETYIFKSRNEPITQTLVGYCDMIVSTQNGPLIHVIDPFGEKIFPIANNDNDMDIQSYTGYMIKLQVEILYYEECPKVINAIRLPYTLTEKTVLI